MSYSQDNTTASERSGGSIATAPAKHQTAWDWNQRRPREKHFKDHGRGKP